MAPTLLIYTHADCSDEIARYCEGMRNAASGYGVEIEVIDLVADPLQAVKAKITQIPTVVAVRDGTMQQAKVGTAPCTVVARWLERMFG
jgi:thioredoxin-like negative regulator of GroEL